MNSSSVHEALALNNEAVSLLQRNEDEQAMQNLMQSLGFFRDMLSATETPSSPEQAKGSSPLQPQHLNQCLSFVPLSGLKSQEMFVFDRAALLNEKPALPSPSPSQPESSSSQFEAYCTECCAAIILNIGLLFHRKSSSNVSLRGKAIKMYEMVLKLISSSCCVGNRNRPPRSGTLMTIHIAALNNIAQLTWSNGSYIDSSLVFQQLSAMLASEESLAIAQVLDRHYVDDMVINILQSSENLGMAAPAA